MKQKDILRHQIRELIGSMPLEERAAISSRICSSVCAGTQWVSARTVLLYASLPDEVDTSLLISNATESGKRIILPSVCGNELRLLEYASGSVRTGRFGIMEPSGNCQEAAPEEIDLAIIPARAYTAGGTRLGRGKGYYDRTMPRLVCPKWGICFPCQLLEDIPSDPWDIKVDRVFTSVPPSDAFSPSLAAR